MTHQLLTLTSAFLIVANVTGNTIARDQAKPWYLRDIKLSESTVLPFSPVTAVILLVSLLMIIKKFLAPGSSSTATASHILMDGNDAKTKLEVLKKEIKNDYSKFTAYAAKYSKCPSGKSGGKLGTFRPGNMVPPFDKAIFDKESRVGETIGPIQTNFGWHLIWIEERNLAD
mmetsp:Transcript_25029/g.51849  ORF Transcript_25029/g.51849 Transcript_25029/m.51849 type:complete len:172 (+) Transcript_25029:178-693(+)|eukprot:CAMPEP_0171328562 /NCGR_PEP_ID=MMETSP0878-20121228/732_1 /TAXON_ID=67004 /ORGANISM="Thalassiosira weissflogii, Strain CCMP1336" /LENGTH=171 /DNA_ID=CAMNT_0011828421 /DNA_START=145 /DNA_END=660 /DNA_ORIENTATION=-